MCDFDVSSSGRGPWKPRGHLEHQEVQLMPTSQFCWREAPVAKPAWGFSCRVGARPELGQALSWGGCR